MLSLKTHFQRDLEVTIYEISDNLYLDPWGLLGKGVKYIYPIHRCFYYILVYLRYPCVQLASKKVMCECSKFIVYYGEFENWF
jgi:hypothetical protein